MASIGYAKPHYRLMTKEEREQYHLGCTYIENYSVPSINSWDIYRVIKAIRCELNLHVIHFNDKYWVVTYP